MASDMVERMARAINEIAFRSWQGMYDYCINSGDSEDMARHYADGAYGDGIARAREAAHAALKALREPTPEMIDAGNRTAGREAQWHCDVQDIWSDMLSAAIGEG